MRIVFVNRYYWPSEAATAQLLTDLAEGLAAAGHKVSVVTGRTGASQESELTTQGVTIHRVGPIMAATQNLLRRALDFRRFRSAAESQLRQTLKRGDVVVPLTDPPLIGVTAE